MERRKLKGVYKNKRGELCEEEFECNYFPDAEETYKHLLDSFNEEEKRRYEDNPKVQDIRTFVSAEWGIAKGVNYCDFLKISIMALKDSKGYYDRVRCTRCGRIKRRYSLDSRELKNIKCKVQEV